jgi:CIC family chloride channel protein
VIRRVRESWTWVLTKPTGRWLVLGGLVGIATGIAGAVFQLATDIMAQLVLGGLAGIDPDIVAQNATPAGSAEDKALWLLPLSMALGGFAAGLVCHHLARSARGGGTGVAVVAFHSHRGRIPARLTWTKLIASVLTLGTGGSGGREGPISLVGAGLGSLLAERLHLTARDRRVLLVAGIAGGIAAVFRAPLTAAIYAIEVLYRGPDLETDALIPSFIAAATGYVSGTMGVDLLQPLIGGLPSSASTLFQPPVLSFHTADWMQLAGYTAVAVTGVLAAWIFGGFMKVVRRNADRHALHAWSTPAFGAGLAGAIALAAVSTARLTVHEPGAALVATATVGSGYGALHWLFSGGGVDAQPGHPRRPARRASSRTGGSYGVDRRLRRIRWSVRPGAGHRRLCGWGDGCADGAYPDRPAALRLRAHGHGRCAFGHPSDSGRRPAHGR